MELITILNRCHHFWGFVYHRATFSPDHKSIEFSVRARKGSAAVCPEIRVRILDYVTLILAILLLVGAVLQILRVRLAAPFVLPAVGGLWLYYIPAIWDEIPGTLWFAMK